MYPHIQIPPQYMYIYVHTNTALIKYQYTVCKTKDVHGALIAIKNSTVCY